MGENFNVVLKCSSPGYNNDMILEYNYIVDFQNEFNLSSIEAHEIFGLSQDKEEYENEGIGQCPLCHQTGMYIYVTSEGEIICSDTKINGIKVDFKRIRIKNIIDYLNDKYKTE